MLLKWIGCFIINHAKMAARALQAYTYKHGEKSKK